VVEAPKKDLKKKKLTKNHSKSRVTKVIAAKVLSPKPEVIVADPQIQDANPEAKLVDGLLDSEVSTETQENSLELETPLDTLSEKSFAETSLLGSYGSDSLASESQMDSELVLDREIPKEEKLYFTEGVIQPNDYREVNETVARLKKLAENLGEPPVAPR